MKDTTNAVAPIECVQKGGDPEKTVVWACGSCKIAKSTKEDALECCAPYLCNECGKEVQNYSCKECTDKKRFAQDQATYDKAKKVMLSEYAGDYLFCDHCNEYFADVDSLLDAHDDEEEPPTWAWGTDEQPFTLNAEDIVAQQLEQQEFYEDALESISGEALKEMQAFFDAWLKKQEMKSYMVNYGVVVDFEALVKQRKKERDDEA